MTIILNKTCLLVIYITCIENMYFLVMFNDSVVKPFSIADNNALSHLGRGICPRGILSRGILSGGILSVSRTA